MCARTFFLIQPSPLFAWVESISNCETVRKTLPGRLELPTLRLTASRSNQLSYGSRCSFGCTQSSMCLICSVLLSSVPFCFVLCCCVGSLAVRFLQWGTLASTSFALVLIAVSDTKSWRWRCHLEPNECLNSINYTPWWSEWIRSSSTCKLTWQSTQLNHDSSLHSQHVHQLWSA